MLADVSGEEVENYMVSNDLVKTSSTATDVATDAGCSDEEHAKMASNPIRFFSERSRSYPTLGPGLATSYRPFSACLHAPSVGNGICFRTLLVSHSFRHGPSNSFPPLPS